MELRNTMKTLYLERSTGSSRNGRWVNELDLDGVERIVVGTGPGSFAGIRSALAFAQGYALGKHCEVFGLPSACAIAAEIYQKQSLPTVPSASRQLAPAQHLAVIGDARQGKAWVALFDGYTMAREVFQVEQSELAAAVPDDAQVTTPDAVRIEALLKETFGDRYLGGQTPTAEGLRQFVEANPAILKSEPLPIYLNPAVR